MTDHNPHRIALATAIGAAEAERDGLNGSARHPFDRLLRHLHAVLVAGDEAEDEPDVEIVTQAEIDERRDARWALAELHLGLARALGRRTRQSTLAAAFGSGIERVSTPDDDVMVDDVRVQRESGAALRKRLAELLGIRSGSTNDGRVIGAVERLIERTGTVEAALVLRNRAVAALGYSDEDEPDADDLIRAIVQTQATAREQRERAERLTGALAVLAGQVAPESEGPLHVEALLLAAVDCSPEPATLDRALAVLRGETPRED